MLAVYEIPADLLSATDITFRIGRRHITSPQPFTAHLRASGPVDERWIAEMTLRTKDREALDRFQAIFDLGDGLSGFFSAFDCVHAYPAGTATGLQDPYAGPTTGERFSDGTTFSDGTEFESGIAFGTIGAAAARGAEYVHLSGLLASQPAGFKVADQFSIIAGGGVSTDYGFLHHVVTNSGTNSAGSATVRIRPRLRQAVVAGQAVQFLRPRGVFRLAEDGAVAFSRGPGGLAQPTLSLVEVPEVLTCAL